MPVKSHVATRRSVAAILTTALKCFCEATESVGLQLYIEIPPCDRQTRRSAFDEKEICCGCRAFPKHATLKPLSTFQRRKSSFHDQESKLCPVSLISRGRMNSPPSSSSRIRWPV